jgi:lipopolysaccharide export LptBFGC system permease protein LptF
MNDVRSRLRRADQFQKSGDDQGYQSEIKAANAALASGYTKRVLSDKDVEKISGDWQADPRVHSFDGLRDWHSAVKVYAAGTPEEQQLWRESLEKKINSEIAKDPRKQDDILAEVQQRFGGH